MIALLFLAELDAMPDEKDCNAADGSKGQPLGDYLANVRTAKRMSLRNVEEAADGVVSNAYLSQLEHGRISKPSPNILHCLARVYGVAYETLMQKAGYIAAAANDETGLKRHGRVATFTKQNLTNEEEEALLEYLAFLRSKKGRKS
ncbi:MAG: transcriptional regulator [Phycisphaerales bacterium]|nr:transcriptional regulator [Phycisphaerales bacterium]